MIRINKDLSAIPRSLIPCVLAYFPPPTAPHITSRTTHSKRLLLIQNESYTDNPEFSSRYKLADIVSSLNLIYYGKCAFCEQKVEMTNVEHYRPKKIYYWLAYSWSNLLLSCPHCNINKGVHFELNGDSATFDNTPENIRDINTISQVYDLIELPKMVNPEVTNPEGHIRFLKDGTIESDDERFNYTIEKCKISRKYLNDERRTLLNNLQDDLRLTLKLATTKDEQALGIKLMISKFLADSNKNHLPFLAFRRFAIANGWLKDVINEIIN